MNSQSHSKSHLKITKKILTFNPGDCFMERINYSQIIQDILSNHSINDIANGTEIQLLFDTQRHHYQVLNIGWKQQIRTYGVRKLVLILKRTIL
jgi:hypothetical protein